VTGSVGVVDEHVRVVRQTRVAPPLDLLERDVAARRVPIGRRDVATMHGEDLRFVGAAAVAGHDVQSGRRAGAGPWSYGALVRQRWVIGFVVAMLVAGCAGDDTDDRGDRVPDAATAVTAGSSPAPPATPAPSSPVAPATTGDDAPVSAPGEAVVPVGFERVQASVELADGSPCELCLWLADDGASRQRGLMEVTDLGAADGMAFVFEEPNTSRFWMGNTPLPLSIAFFAADGSFVSTQDMDPCPAADDSCLRYGAAAAYVTAIEFARGDVERLGIGPGSVLTLTDLPCD